MDKKSQKELILYESWDYLIILDDCRYDFFEKNYEDFISGDLTAVESADDGTPSWYQKVFHGSKFPETVYISANPHINSQELDPIGGRKCKTEGIFKEVVDVWDYGWDQNLKTVPPKEVSKALLKNKGKRAIAHYNQPHSPFIPMLRENKENGERELGGNIFSLIPRKIKRRLNGIVYYLPPQLRKGIKSFLRRKPRNPERILKKWGKEILRKYYEKNLRIVLSELERIIPELEGNIIITSDHGEWLGENGKTGHRKMEVPWLEIIKS